MSSIRTQVDRRRFLARSASLFGAAALGALPRRMQASQDISGPGSLKRHAADARLLFGFAVDVSALGWNAPYRQLVEEQCSIVTPDNAMKWNALAPTPTEYKWDEADALIAFSDRTQIKVRGHALCWHAQLPAWFDSVATPTNARRLLTDHIRTVAGRYAGRMHSWDVVNEAVNVNDGRPDGLRNSPWLRLIGTDYLEVAFKTAREADPTALLTYNDYDLEFDAPKRAAVLALLRRMKQRNIPIDAVGLQSHLIGGDHYAPGVLQFLEACREMDLQVFLTEMDVNEHVVPGDQAERDRVIAATYGEYLSTTLKARNVTTVVTWGVTNGNSWLKWSGQNRPDNQPIRPLLFDDRYQPTKAFTAVRNAFDHRPQRYSGLREPVEPPADRPPPL